jgi:peptidyl-tRNA hydrolase
VAIKLALVVRTDLDVGRGKIACGAIGPAPCDQVDAIRAVLALL